MIYELYFEQIIASLKYEIGYLTLDIVAFLVNAY